MTQYIIELGIALLAMYLLGCLAGALAWRRFGREPVAAEPDKPEGEELKP